MMSNKHRYHDTVTTTDCYTPLYKIVCSSTQYECLISIVCHVPWSAPLEKGCTVHASTLCLLIFFHKATYFF